MPPDDSRLALIGTYTPSRSTMPSKPRLNHTQPPGFTPLIGRSLTLQTSETNPEHRQIHAPNPQSAPVRIDAASSSTHLHGHKQPLHLPHHPHAHDAHQHKEIANTTQLPATHLTLSSTVRASLHKAIQGSLDPRTAKTYERAVARFVLFCNQERIPTPQHFPASEELLCPFVASNMGKCAGTTVKKMLAGVRSFHIDNGLLWSGSTRLTKTLKAIDHLAPPSQPPRQGLLLNDLQTLVLNLNLRDPFDAAATAITTCAFWGQARLGELLPDSSFPKESSIAKLPLRSDLDDPSPSGKSRSLHLPFPKTKHQKGDFIVIPNQSGLVNPLPILQIHLNLNKPSSQDPLFSFVARDKHQWISKKVFLSRCNTILSSHSKATITGHAFRIGGTTELLILGVNPDVVRRLGRWESDSFMRYWRRDREISEKNVVNVVSRTRSA